MRPRFLRDFLVGLAYIVIIVALMVVAVLVYDKTFVSTVDVSLVSNDVGTSLQKGADVEVRGVVVGSVSSISTNGTTARVGLALTPAQAARLPRNVTAQLLPKTLFGQRFVNLVEPAKPSPDHLHSGDVIKPDTSTGTTELQDVFAHLLPVLRAVHPAQLSTTLGALAASLRGEGTNLGVALQTFSVYLHRFEPQVPQLLRDLHNFGNVARTYQLAAPDLLAALRNFTVTNRTIAAQHAQFADLLRSVTSSSNRLGDFVRTNSADIITLSRDSVPTLRVLQRYSPEFPCLSRALVDFIPTMNSALGAGTNQPGLHATLRVLPARQPYTSGPVYHGTGGPSCPQVSAVQTSATAIGANLAPNVGIGTENSPQENAVIAELMAHSMHTTPQQVPDWASLLLGPALRGTTVTVK